MAPRAGAEVVSPGHVCPCPPAPHLDSCESFPGGSVSVLLCSAEKGNDPASPVGAELAHLFPKQELNFFCLRIWRGKVPWDTW